MLTSRLSALEVLHNSCNMVCPKCMPTILGLCVHIYNKIKYLQVEYNVEMVHFPRGAVPRPPGSTCFHKVVHPCTGTSLLITFYCSTLVYGFNYQKYLQKVNNFVLWNTVFTYISQKFRGVHPTGYMLVFRSFVHVSIDPYDYYILGCLIG